MPTAASCAFLSCLAADAKLCGVMSSAFLEAHRATLTQNGNGFSLAYQIRAEVSSSAIKRASTYGSRLRRRITTTRLR
jgi:hypothetical protein